MKRLRALTFRICPTPEQESLLSRHAGCTGSSGTRLSTPEAAARGPNAASELRGHGEPLTLWRESDECGFLALAPSQPQQQTLKNLDRAIREALDKKNPRRFPRFKRKGEKTSILYPQGTNLDLSTTGPRGKRSFRS